MVIPKEQDLGLAMQGHDAADDDAEEAWLQRRLATHVMGGGASVTLAPPSIIVDLREFNAAFPFHLHTAPLTLLPATLDVGDYIPTPHHCLERKSLPDLLQSLASGRLYHQAVAMQAHYPHPLLLLEFDPSRPFLTQSLQRAYAAARRPGDDRIVGGDVTARLVMLVLAVPRLRLLWSATPRTAVQMILDLKVRLGVTLPVWRLIDRSICVCVVEGAGGARFGHGQGGGP